MIASVLGILLSLSGICYAGLNGPAQPGPHGSEPAVVFPIQGCPGDAGWKEFYGHCYKLVGAGDGSGGASVTASVAQCKRSGPFVDGGITAIAYLADIYDPMENAFVAEIVADNTRAWIGLIRGSNGPFYWMTENPTEGSEITAESFTNWKLYEPNNTGGDEDCVEINRGRSGKWNDLKCKRKLPAVCKYSIGRLAGDSQMKGY